MTKYLFIDGASFEATISSYCSKLFKDEDIFNLLNFNAISRGYQRVFYYDSLPAKTKIQNDTEFAVVTERKQKFFDKINRSRNCHVHSAFSKYKKGRGQEQKGVDVLLAIEVLQHAYQGNMDAAVIITSDLDFMPVFDALTHTRVSSELIYQKEATSGDLIYSADMSSYVTLQNISQWINEPFSQKLRVFNTGFGPPSDKYDIIEKRKVLDFDVMLGKIHDEDAYVGVFNHPEGVRFIRAGCIEAIVDNIENNPGYNEALRW